MTKRPFTSKGVGAKECLELVHIDVCGPFNVQTHGGMSISSPSLKITLGMVMFALCIGNPMPWINSRNLMQNWKTS